MADTDLRGDEALAPPPDPIDMRQELLRELWCDEDPFAFADLRQVDDGYPNTYLPWDLVDAILQVQGQGEAKAAHPIFWLELGTALGGSAMRTADCAKRLAIDTTICCIDPFAGDVNMWAWEKGRRERDEWRYLRLQAGRPTLYERFRANVRAAGHDDLIVPLPCTSLVGLRLLRLLVDEGRLSRLPDVIYLDAAHEPGETLLELESAWLTLRAGGILFGDDWVWPSVRGDVEAFARRVAIDADRLVAFLRHFNESTLEGNAFLYRGQWMLCKPLG